MAASLTPDDLTRIQRAYARADVRGWSVALAVLGGLALFLATAILLVKGGPNPGPRLSLIGEYLPGYRVSWPGALVGGLYGVAIGFAAGRIIGSIYNVVVSRSDRG